VQRKVRGRDFDQALAIFRLLGHMNVSIWGVRGEREGSE